MQPLALGRDLTGACPPLNLIIGRPLRSLLNPILIKLFSGLTLTPFFFFNDTATTEIYTLSLHDALPISPDRALAAASPASSAGPRAPARTGRRRPRGGRGRRRLRPRGDAPGRERAATDRLNSRVLPVEWRPSVLPSGVCLEERPRCRSSTSRASSRRSKSPRGRTCARSPRSTGS